MISSYRRLTLTTFRLLETIRLFCAELISFCCEDDTVALFLFGLSSTLRALVSIYPMRTSRRVEVRSLSRKMIVAPHTTDLLIVPNGVTIREHVLNFCDKLLSPIEIIMIQKGKPRISKRTRSGNTDPTIALYVSPTFVATPHTSQLPIWGRSSSSFEKRGEVRRRNTQ